MNDVEEIALCEVSAEELYEFLANFSIILHERCVLLAEKHTKERERNMESLVMNPELDDCIKTLDQDLEACEMGVSEATTLINTLLALNGFTDARYTVSQGIHHSHVYDWVITHKNGTNFTHQVVLRIGHFFPSQ